MSPDQSEWAAWAASVKTIFADVTKNDAFDEVIAAWDEPLCCQTVPPCAKTAQHILSSMSGAETAQETTMSHM